MSEEKLLEVGTVAILLGVSYHTVRRLMESGQLRWTSRGVSKGYRVFENSVKQFKDGRDNIAA